MLGAAALTGFLFSFILAIRQGATRAFVAVPFKTLVFVAPGLMANNAFYLAAIARIGPFTVANVLQDKVTPEGSASTISSLAFLTPLVAMGLLAVFDPGVVTTATIVGALFAITGALLSSGARKG